MLQDNVIAPHVDFTHEPFAHHLQKTIDRWRNGPEDGVYGSVGHDHIVLPILVRELDPTWAFLWREPLPLIMSALGWRRRNRKRMPTDGETLLRAFYTFAGLDSALMFAEKMGVKPTHWHFDQYTKGKGLRLLAKEFGLDLRAKLIHAKKRGVNATPGKFKVTERNCTKKVLDYVKELEELFPRVKQGLELARERKNAAGF